MLLLVCLIYNLLLGYQKIKNKSNQEGKESKYIYYKIEVYGKEKLYKFFDNHLTNNPLLGAKYKSYKN